MPVWNKLDAEAQDIVLQAAKDAAAYERAENYAAEASQIEELKAAGMNIIEDPDLTAFSEAVQPIYEKYGAKFGDYLPRIQEALK